MRNVTKFIGRLILCSSFALAGGCEMMKGDKKPMAKMPDMKQQQEMMEKAAAVGPQHQQLARHFAGNWTADVTMYMPGQPNDVSKGEMKNQTILGGRFIEQHYKGQAMGQPFEGVSFVGYDNTQKKYVGTWFDTMSTGQMTMMGTYNESKKQYLINCEFFCPATNDNMKMREVITIVDDDHQNFEMFGPGPDGKEIKMMEIKYSRAK